MPLCMAVRLLHDRRQPRGACSVGLQRERESKTEERRRAPPANVMLFRVCICACVCALSLPQIAQSEVCDQLPPRDRVGLIVAGPAYGGTSAFLSLLRQSTSLTTVCAAGTWQCEVCKVASDIFTGVVPMATSVALIHLFVVSGHWERLVEHKIVWEPQAAGPTSKWGGDPPVCRWCVWFPELAAFFNVELAGGRPGVWHRVAQKMGALKKVGVNVTRMISTELQQLTGILPAYVDTRGSFPSLHPGTLPMRLQRLAVWLNLSKNILLLSKHSTGARYWLYNASHYATPAALPSRLRNAGIARIKPRAIVLWTPLCVARQNHSHHADRNGNASHAVKYTLWHLHQTVQSLWKFASLGIPAIALSQGDVLWDGGAVRRRLHAFVPCLGQLSTEADPHALKWAKGNTFKAHGSIAEYGRQHPRNATCGHPDTYSQKVATLVAQVVYIEEDLKRLGAAVGPTKFLILQSMMKSYFPTQNLP